VGMRACFMFTRVHTIEIVVYYDLYGSHTLCTGLIEKERKRETERGGGGEREREREGEM
jgi:hypothetical protein